MPRFRHKRHNRVRQVAESQAEGFRSSPHWLEIAEDGSDDPVSASPPVDTTEDDLIVPDGNVAEVLGWAGDDPDRKAAALYAERRGKGRTTLIDKLSE